MKKMSWIAWILVVVFFSVVLIVGTSKFWKPARYWRGVNTNEKSAEWLVLGIKKAKKSVYIVSGNLNPYVFDLVAESIPKRLREAPGLKIRILTGPEILTLQGENKLLNLANSQDFIQEFGERFEIAFLSQRPVTHFRVIDSADLYVEEPHEVGASRRIVETLENSKFKSWQYERHFERLWQISARAKPRLVPLEGSKQGSVQ